MPIAFQPKRGQTAVFVRAGIEADPISAELRSSRLNRMAVHHDLAVIGPTAQESLTDPNQIAITLLVQSDSWSDARMTKK